jgi:DNA polymerase III psi subunit
MDIKEYVTGTSSPEICQRVLGDILKRYLDPAFGSLTKKEVDLLIIEALEDIRFISYDPSLYDIINKLHITRSKARSLIYENELRHLQPCDLDKRVKAALINPILQKDGDFYYLEIENPMVAEHLRAKLHDLKFVTDATFSPSLIKLSLNAIAGIIEYYMNKDERENVRKILVAAGAPDKSLSGVLKGVLKALALKYAQDAGGALVDSASCYISAILDGTVETMQGKFKELF